MAKLLNNTFFTIQMGVSFDLARLASEMSIDSEVLSWGPSGSHRRQLDHGSVCGIGVHPPRPSPRVHSSLKERAGVKRG